MSAQDHEDDYVCDESKVQIPRPRFLHRKFAAAEQVRTTLEFIVKSIVKANDNGVCEFHMTFVGEKKRIGEIISEKLKAAGYSIRLDYGEPDRGDNFVMVLVNWKPSELN